MERLRMPLFVAALVVWVLVVGAEVGLPLVETRAGAGAVQQVLDSAATELGIDVDPQVLAAYRQEHPPPPGVGVPYLALLDGLFLFTLVMMGLPELITQKVHGRIHGVVTVVVSLVVIGLGIVLVQAAVLLLQLMLSLLLSPPWGTIAYLATFGSFDTGGAAAITGAVMTLKATAAVLLVLAQPRFLKDVALLLQLVSGVVAVIVVTFLHGIVPGFLVSITDAIAGIVVGIIAIVWAIVFLVGGIVAVVKLVAP